MYDVAALIFVFGMLIAFEYAVFLCDKVVFYLFITSPVCGRGRVVVLCNPLLAQKRLFSADFAKRIVFFSNEVDCNAIKSVLMC